MTDKTDISELDAIDEDNLLILGSRFSRLKDTDDKTLHRFRRARDHHKEHQSKRRNKRDLIWDE